MTSTLPARVRPDVRRPGTVYGINILDPATGLVRVDYVGKTRQQVKARGDQHRDDQPWSDLIVGDLVVLAQGVWTEPELDAQERAWIGRLRPRYNYEHNLDNPLRVPIPVAREQRWARDDAAGRPRWVPPARRIPGTRPAPVVVRPVAWRGWQVWAAAWLLLWPAGWVEASRAGAEVWSAAGIGAFAAAALVGWGIGRGRTRRRSWWWLRPPRRQRRRR